MAIPRILEPEVMDTAQAAADYDAMDFTEVNNDFAQLALELGPESGRILDLGTGTARIPLLLAQARPHWQITAVDLAASMLTIGQQHIDQAQLHDQITLLPADAKSLPLGDQSFDLIISNSLVHHLPDPLPFFAEIQRLLHFQGALLIRDLIRPQTEAGLQNILMNHGGNSSPNQLKLFQDSLRASFTLSEIKTMIHQAGIKNVEIYQSSNRHWTVARAVRLL
ncbi:class I SAM-dependent methyltransferase [Thermosynechococcaceae cyanobacterium BACA0444]|uniref:Class I SAM-dependent methyltransferase n=1 Tax=Pseudocalidococcus azoricus BACA0444 TaxID=2918990 RepID=A0AAE4FSQ0_9CYAN|nr:class I SAM-dependent methyltransferase [Pseudocalidococcus azoricus]MDS3860260.1 class I SAM-dependent methyltransferase [Pseudocalidococcus azoricus BACA0444]